MIAVDTNILVHAHRADSPWHQAAVASLASLSERAWAIPWPCVHEFLAIVTHPKIFDPPTPLPEAWRCVERWLEASSVRTLAESPGYAEALGQVLLRSRVVGPKIHDARIAALCLHHSVGELWTADRDFSRFARLKVRNPLLS